MSLHQPSKHDLRAIAADPATLPARLEQLAQSEELAPLVAGNPNTTAQMLLRLAEKHPREVLANPVLPLLVVESPEQFTHMPPKTALRLLSVETLPEWLPTLLAQHASPAVRETTRHHIQVAGELPEAGWRGWDRATRRATRSGPGPVPAEDGEEARDAIRHAVLTVGNSHPIILPQRPAEWLLDLLADHHESAIRRAIAAREDTHPHFLARLAADPDFAVRQEVVKNPQTPPDLREQLAADYDVRVRCAVAACPLTPLEILQRYLTDKKWEVRAELARQKRLSLALIIQLTSDPEPRVRREI